jgi:hypothetical protein
MFDQELYNYAEQDNQLRLQKKKPLRKNVAWVSSDYFRFQQSSPLFFRHAEFKDDRERAATENNKRIETWSDILQKIRRGVLSIEDAYIEVKQIRDVGHFRSMVSLQLASLMGIIPIIHFQFACTSSGGGFKSYDFLKRHSIEFEESKHPSKDEAMSAAWNNLTNSTVAAGYDLPDVVIEQLGCLFERRENLDLNGVLRPIVRFDLILESSDNKLQNFYKADKNYSCLMILVKGMWHDIALYLVPWYKMQKLDWLTKPKFVSEDEFPQQPFN